MKQAKELAGQEKEASRVLEITDVPIAFARFEMESLVFV